MNFVKSESSTQFQENMTISEAKDYDSNSSSESEMCELSIEIESEEENLRSSDLQREKELFYQGKISNLEKRVYQLEEIIRKVCEVNLLSDIRI